MARPKRVNIAGGLFHLIQRGNNRQRLFFTDDDRRAFLDRLERCLRECACRLHAYCLMSNHLHLLVQTDRPNLSVFGQRLFGGHTKWVNRRHRRVGHLFQGRFSSSLVDEDPYLLQLSRYIHLNPVKARMVRQPEDYPWSSLRAYLPRARGPSWVHTATTLAYFRGSRQRYVAFVHEGIGREGEPSPELDEADREGAPNGADHTSVDPSQVGRRAGAAEDQQAVIAGVLGEVSRAWGVRPEVLQRKYMRDPRVAQAKTQAAVWLRQRTGLSLAAIGRQLGGISAQAVDRWLQLSPKIDKVDA